RVGGLPVAGGQGVQDGLEVRRVVHLGGDPLDGRRDEVLAVEQGVVGEAVAEVPGAVDDGLPELLVARGALLVGAAGVEDVPRQGAGGGRGLGGAPLGAATGDVGA